VNLLSHLVVVKMAGALQVNLLNRLVVVEVAVVNESARMQRYPSGTASESTAGCCVLLRRGLVRSGRDC
jgi:hypothetical protein